MQILKCSAVVAVFAAILLSCGGKENSSATETTDTTQTVTPPTAGNGTATRLEGDWEIKRAEGDMASMNEGTVYSFRGNKLAFGKGSYKNPGSTEVTDSTFSFQADGNELKFMYNYRFNGDTLVVEMQKGSGQVFHLVKQ